MLTTAIEELARQDSPVRLVVAENSSSIQVGRCGSVRAYVWGRMLDTAGQELSADQVCAQVAQRGIANLTAPRGHFALVVADLDSSQARILADRFVTHRLYYTCREGQLWVGESLQQLTRALPGAPELSLQSVVNYLFFHMIPSPETLYEGIFSLTPAVQVILESGRLRRERHWTPVPAPDLSVAAPDFAQQLFATLDQSVQGQLYRPNMGCFLSGGLDSSSIAGLVSRHRQQAPVFSIGFPVEQYNELDYARCAVKQFGLTGFEYVMSPDDVVNALPHIVASMDQPFGNSSVLPTYFCAKLAKAQGVDALVAGDGGDELFAGNERYAHQLRLERWRQRLGPVVGLLDAGLLKPQWPDSLALLRKAKSFTRQLRMTIPENLEYYNFLNLIDRKILFSNRVMAKSDLYAPDQRCQQLYDELGHASALDRMLYMDWKHTLADNDLIKVTTMCRLAGVDVAYPMLDDRLVDLSLTVPSDLKLTPANLRHLYKVAMQGFLPEKIINKKKHGFGLPFGVWTSTHQGLQTLAYNALDRLRERDLFNPAFLDEVKRLHQQEHAKHYGELVWVLMVLSLWLDEHC